MVEEPVAQPKDERSMTDVLREKREAAERALQQSQNNVESIEERKKRLQAQRDLLVKQKQEKRERELGEFKEKTSTGNKDDLHSALLDIDRQAKAKAAAKKQATAFIDDIAGGNDDKRMAMYKNMRDEIFKEDSKLKGEAQNKKMEELNARMAAIELAKRSEEEKQKQMEKEEMARLAAANAAKNNQGKFGFLDNIKSFDVEDI